MKKISILTACLVSLPLIASAEVKIDNSVIEPNKAHEVCMKLDEGQKMEYSFKSSKSMSFNIHYHEDDKVNFPVEEHLTDSDTNSFTSPIAHGYCMMWTNKNEEAVELNVEYEIQ